MNTKIVECVKVAANLLVDNGLGDWHLDVKDVKSFHAQTRYGEKKVTYSSRAMTVATKEQFVGITLHEIAHALVGPGHGHDRTFKAKYYELSGNMDYAGYATRLNTGTYLTKCNNCGETASVNNERKRYCRPCWTNRRKTIELELTPNPLKMVVW